MSKKIGLLNEKVIKGQLKELVRGSVEENRYVKVVIVGLTVGMIMRKSDTNNGGSYKRND